MKFDIDEFVRRVTLMRDLQRLFFSTGTADRPPDLLRKAKAAERVVDEMLDARKGQGLLFGDEEEDISYE